ncbi:hypothetical protein N665_0423s0010 [Sinapis alba]|nr:hypothetical protein N665_0423s0010 [Sinapis alba]
MDQIRFKDVVATIAIIFLLVIAEQANAVSVDADCYGQCTNHCEQTCKSKGYTGWFCSAFRGKSGCCCTPRKKISEQSVQLNN